MKREIFGVVLGLAAGIAMGQEKNPIWAVGGTVLVTNGYVLHTFTNQGGTNLIVTRSKPIPELEVLVVGGGGAGGGTWYHGGGGGGGGVVHGIIKNVTGSNYIFVGKGGLGHGERGNKGEDSKFETWTAYGGGAGGVWENGTYKPPLAGGSGGGSASYNAQGQAATGAPSTQVSGSNYTGHGHAGGNGWSIMTNSRCAAGGGGGAGAPGGNGSSIGGGAGGDGVLSIITGTNVFYGGGGGGSETTNIFHGGSGGLGGGGDAAEWDEGGAAGAANTGGGGGAAKPAIGGYGGAGGSGIVIVRYFPGKITQFSVVGKSMSAIRGNDIRSVRAPE